MSKASSRRKSAANLAAISDNVIQLPVQHRAEANAVQSLLFADEDLRDAPPRMIEKAPISEAKPRKVRAAIAQQPASKKTKAPTGKQAKGKTAKVKIAPARKRGAKTPKPVAIIADEAAVEVAAAANHIRPEAALPIERAMAPVVWRKNGPIDAVRFWLRSAGRTVKAAFAARLQKDVAAKLADPRLRTRNELLLEIAILRQENAAMRKKLGLPAAPFGRLLADRV